MFEQQVNSYLKKAVTVILLLTFLSGCATTLPQASLPAPTALVEPIPREDSQGKYLSPYTSDDVVAPWVEKGMSARVGGVAGSLAAQKVLESVPLAGLFANKVGSSIGRAAALELVGGVKFMRSSTDLSFDNLEDMVVYTYVRHSGHVDYDRVIKLVGDIYPEYKEKQYSIIYNASIQGK